MKNSLPFTISGTVSHGKQLGRKLDVPTANIIPNEDVSALEQGVYYSVITIDGVTYRSITNLGIRPTVEDSGIINAETFVYDFDGELYDSDVTVTLLEFRRPEIRFESVSELQKMMQRDLAAGKDYRK